MFKRYVPFLVALCTMVLFSASASALTPASGWEVTSSVYPTDLSPGGSGVVELDVYNTGAASSTGTVTVTDTLPPGLTATEAGGLTAQGEVIDSEEEVELYGGERWHCTGATVVTCTSDPGFLPNVPPLPGKEAGPGEEMERIGIAVEVASGASGALVNQVTVAGGGVLAPASVSGPVTVSSAPAGFGVAGWDGWFSNRDGTQDTQAGSHPYEATFALDLNSVLKGEGPATAGGRVRNIETVLPAGLIGDPNAVPQCTRQQLDESLLGSCPASTQVGILRVRIEFGYETPTLATFAVYNMVPPPGEPAQFAFDFNGERTFFDPVVRSGGDYGITVHVDNIEQNFVPVLGSDLTLWGVPAEASHNSQRRGAGCGERRPEEIKFEGKLDGCASSAALLPYLTLPTSCGGPLTTTVRASTWENASTGEASYLSHDASGAPVGFGDCEHLGFGPSISVAPDTSEADTPAGLTVELRVPQEGLSNVEGLATSNIKNTTVTLPEGVVINPGQAAGLQACQESEAHIHVEGEPPSCPSASQVGTVQIETPLLKDKLEGDVYVLQSNPPNLQLLVAASGDGVSLKLVGNVHLDETTGRLTTTFTETPELPFTDFKLSFSGGAQAALATPTECGTYSTSADFTPWSTPFVADLLESSSFAIDSGPGGSACASPLPFDPILSAGSTTDQAGGFTDFSMLLSRGDDQQRISSLRFQTPEGLLGMISKVPLCPEPQASQGACSSVSQIGHTVVEAGPGPYPLVVPQPGQSPAPIYLTGGYEGAPYGLSIMVPLVVGPFTLQTQIVRAKIEVDPITARLTVTTDPLPQIIDGVPADLRTIDAVIDRPEFMFNPTGCEPQSFSGTAYSDRGAQAPISSHFQMGSCQSLKFKPDFKVSTSGQNSRKDGASLDAKILYPSGPFPDNQASVQSNIKSVKVDLPKQLPSRLTTLQKACPSATFGVNPASCPADSKVGTASAITPVLPVTLTGPVYFVSYGGAKFPELVIVLQGYGVTVYLHGETFISKAGITSSTFRQVPDVPITSFELKLPQGPYSALAANGNLCDQKLVMPTHFVGQNGAELRQNTPIEVEGCSATLSISSHSIKKTTATLSIYVPAAGRVKVSGNGLNSKTITAKGRETLTVKLTQRKAGRLTRKVAVLFTPSAGKDRRKQSESVTLKFAT